MLVPFSVIIHVHITTTGVCPILVHFSLASDNVIPGGSCCRKRWRAFNLDLQIILSVIIYFRSLLISNIIHSAVTFSIPVASVLVKSRSSAFCNVRMSRISRCLSSCNLYECLFHTNREAASKFDLTTFPIFFQKDYRSTCNRRSSDFPRYFPTTAFHGPSGFAMKS